MTRCMFALAAAVMAMGVAVDAAADEGFVGYRAIGLTSTDAGYVATQDSSVGNGGGPFVGYDPAGIEGFRGMLGIDRLGGADASTRFGFAGDLDSRWARTRVMAMADYSVPFVGDWLGPVTRLGVGYTYQRLSLTADTLEYRDTDHGLGGLVAGGIEARLGGDGEGDTLRNRVSVVGNLLVGYDWQTTGTFDEMRPERQPDDEWDRPPYDAGTVQASGVTWELGLQVQYRFGDGQ